MYFWQIIVFHMNNITNSKTFYSTFSYHIPPVKCVYTLRMKPIPINNDRVQLYLPKEILQFGFLHHLHFQIALIVYQKVRYLHNFLLHHKHLHFDP